MGTEIVFVDTSRMEAVKSVLEMEVKALFVQSLTNPMLRVADVSAISKPARDWKPAKPQSRC